MERPLNTNKNVNNAEISSLLVLLLTAAVAIFSLTIVLCASFNWGVVLGFSLFSTCFGLLMTAVLTIKKISDNRTNWLTLLGVIMSAAGYLACLKGVFHPVSELYLKTNQNYELSPNTNNCKYVVAKGTLTCDVAIQPGRTLPTLVQ